MPLGGEKRPHEEAGIKPHWGKRESTPGRGPTEAQAWSFKGTERRLVILKLPKGRLRDGAGPLAAQTPR